MNWKDLAFYIFKKNLIFKNFNYFNVLILKKKLKIKKYIIIIYLKNNFYLQILYKKKLCNNYINNKIYSKHCTFLNNLNYYFSDKSSFELRYN